MLTVDLDARAAVLAALRRESEAVAELSDPDGPAGGRRHRQNTVHVLMHMRRAEIAARAYLDMVPVLPLSRCPLTGVAIRRSLDPIDIDGPWWDALAPVRPREPHQPTLFGATGALALHGDPAWTPFMVAPGPEVPCVVPRLLEHPGIQAVVSSVPVGPHTGYLVCYFADPLPEDVRRVDDWGARSYAVTADPPAPQGWGSADSDADTVDPDLAPWIRAGRLHWIAPGDRGLHLRSDLEGCPYLDLPGSPVPARIRYGEVRRPSAPPALQEAPDVGA